MKILQVMAGGDHGGAETAFVDMCIAMHEAGMEIQVATRANEVRVPMLQKAGITVHELPFGGPIDVFTPWKMTRIIRDFKPLIVQTWMSRAAQKTPNWKTTKTDQRYLVVSRLGGYYKVGHFKNTDYFNTITPDLKRHLVEGGIEENRILHINNFAEMEKDITPVTKAEFNTPDDAPVLLTLARLHPSKALDILLEALVDLPGVYAWLAGEGPQREELEQLAKDLGVFDRVRFLGWRTDRAALLEAADICIFASRIEPFGTVFVQAWAQKTPVIVSDADGPKQFCIDGEDSLMVPKNDVSALRDAIARMIADKDLQARVVQRGFDRYMNEFTKEKTVTSYLEYFLGMLRREKII
jgi:glycosyltransferase involved in cell wall biosynthesis